METVCLKGGQLHITENRTLYRVKTGHILVFLFPYSGGKPGRRQFLLELCEGEAVPGFAFENRQSGSWRIGLTALDTAEVSPAGRAEDSDLLSFAGKIGLHPADIGTYDEELIECYNLSRVKEEGYLYATEKEQTETREKGLELIHSLFLKKKDKQPLHGSGDELYDTMAFLCSQSGMSIVSLEKVRESCGRNYTVEDIARLSHFVTREVALAEKWYRKDAGPLLVREKDGRKAIACIPAGPGHYLAYRAGEKRPVLIDETFAKSLQPKGISFCVPFPNKPMRIKDLLAFGFRHIYKGDIVRMLFLLLLSTLMGLLIPWLNEQLYDTFIPMGNQGGLAGICGVVLACMVGNVSFSIVKNLAAFRCTSSMKYAVQMAAYDRLFNLPESFLRQYDAADLNLRVQGITVLFDFLSSGSVMTLLTAVFSLMYLWRMYRYSARMSSIALILLAAVLIYLGWIGFRQRNLEKQKVELDRKAQSLITQILNGISKIRIAGAEDRVLYEYLKPCVESRRIRFEKEKMTIQVNTMNAVIPVLFSMIFYYLMGEGDLQLTAGAFIGFTSAFSAFSAAMLETVHVMMEANEIRPVYHYSRLLLETPVEYEEDIALPGDLNGDIELNNVSFAYDEETGTVLHDLSFHVKAGEYVGIVGSSGSGKSTLLKLLLGFEKPQVGKIYYDGRDIDGMDKRELRKKIGTVLQDGGLIPGSIRDNITITAPYATAEQVKEVLQETGLEEDIKKMPMGLQTVMSEDSGTISGGQKQRILIARAVIGRPKILFFDEATSALDNVTQAMVCENLEKLHATRIVIAHRLSTVIHCDRILVLEQGKLVEEGNYEELMAKKGRFYQMALRQIS